jgi:hypothetical protein
MGGMRHSQTPATDPYTLHEVYFSVLFSSQAPFDHYSIKLTPEQIEDCKLILGKYEELIKEK